MSDMPPAFAEFLSAVLVMELTPGPNMAWLALLAAQRGRLLGLQAVAGIATGLAVLAVLAGLGAAALFSTYPPIYEALRWAGVLFMLYLALDAWRGEDPDSLATSPGRHFRRGLLVNLLNPKAAVVFLVMIPAFAGEANPEQPPIVLMTTIYLVIATLVHTLIIAFAGTFTKALMNPHRELVVRRGFALLLVAIAIWFAVSTGRPDI